MGEWIRSKITEIAAKGIETSLVATGKLLLQFDDLILIIAIVGIYLIIFGNKKMGTRMTSLSILIYFLAEVMSNVK